MTPEVCIASHKDKRCFIEDSNGGGGVAGASSYLSDLHSCADHASGIPSEIEDVRLGPRRLQVPY
eukprot:4910763-Pyramimonas_sp.AAC.1